MPPCPRAPNVNDRFRPAHLRLILARGSVWGVRGSVRHGASGGRGLRGSTAGEAVAPPEGDSADRPVTTADGDEEVVTI